MTLDGLEAVLADSHRLGFLGPGPVGPHIEHARAFDACLPAGISRLLDLGSGGGVPGLVLAALRPDTSVVLLDASQRRTAFLREAVERLGMASQVRVVTERAEAAARAPELRSQFDAVVARSFGPPAVTAECAAGFLPAGGVLVVSEPPDEATDRWPRAGLAQLGFGPAVRLGTASAGFVRIPRLEHHDRWPRRVGIPAKRPLW